MPSSNLPPDLDTDRLAETALALLSLTLHDHGRVWKSLDWDVLDLLHESSSASTFSGGLLDGC
jgi:hypothetical protein